MTCTGLPADSAPRDLADAYRICRRIAAEHGRTYFLATRLLSASRRPAVHALYAFARMVDDIVDHPRPISEAIGYMHRAARGEPHTADRATGIDSAVDIKAGSDAGCGALRTERIEKRPAPDHTAAQGHQHTPEHGRAGELDLIEKQLRVALEQGGPDADAAPPGSKGRLRAHVLLALTDTVDSYGIAPQHFWTFLDSMRMDVPGTARFRDRYPTMAELRDYMHGSAAAIGLQLLPVLGTVVPVAEAEPAAAALGEAFQLTNFLRDIGEDLDRGRVYLPGDELAAFGVDNDLLAYCRRTGRTDQRLRRALAHFIAVNRDSYRTADRGIDLLAPRVRPAIRTASTLYAAILDRIEQSGYQVFAHRAVVPRGQRLRLVSAELIATVIGPTARRS